MKKYLSMNFRADWFEAIEAFPEDRQLDAYRAIMRYAFYGEVPEDPSIKMAIGLIMHLIDKRRVPRKPKEAAEPAPNTDSPAQPIENKDITAESACQNNEKAEATGQEKCARTIRNAVPRRKPIVVKRIPVRSVLRNVRCKRRAVCRSTLRRSRVAVRESQLCGRDKSSPGRGASRIPM